MGGPFVAAAIAGAEDASLHADTAPLANWRVDVTTY